MRNWKRWGMTLLALFTVGVIVACQNSSPTTDEATIDCTPMQHAAGTTCVPKTFERLVTLDSVVFEDAIALGVKPVATVASSFSSHFQNQTTDVKNIGQAGEPSLENVLTVNPDLILGLDSHRPIYAQTSRIAPTVLLEFEHSGQWKEVFQNLSKTLGRADVGQQVMDDYRKRLEEFKAEMGIGAASPEENRRPKVSVVRIYPNSINLYLRDSFPGTVLQDAGLARPPSQDIGAEDAQRIADNPIQMQISQELLSQIDGDVLFVWTAENEAEANQAAQKKLEKLKADPLWKTLNVVQKNQVYVVPNYWIGNGPLSANAILNDLFKYLVEQPQS